MLKFKAKAIALLVKNVRVKIVFFTDSLKLRNNKIPGSTIYKIWACVSVCLYTNTHTNTLRHSFKFTH